MSDINIEQLNLDEILKDLVSLHEKRYFNVSISDILSSDFQLLLPLKLDQQCFDFMFK